MKRHKKLFAFGLSIVFYLGAASGWSQTVSSSVIGSATAQSCSGGDTGPVSPCSATNVASNGGTEVKIGASNPINVISGNKYQREDDLPALPGVLGLEVVRHYNSLHGGPGSPNGILGRGWRLSYETALHATGRALQITQADGTRVIFSRDPFDPSRCATANPADGAIRISKTARGNEYAWTWPNGRRLDFDSKGKLIQILAPTGEFVTLSYNRRGWLDKVADPQGRSLHLRYPDKAARGTRFTGVMAIDTPVGQFRYDHGSALPGGAVLDPVHVLANLTRVIIPRGEGSDIAITRSYHYEDARHPTLLTGISISDGQGMNRRIATYGYNANGLAVLSVKGEPARYVKDEIGQPVTPPRLVEGTGIEQVMLDFSEPGQTTLTNSLGRKTVYRHTMLGGGLRLLEGRGAGCAGCGEPNMRYGYDRLGRLIATTRLAVNGKPLETIERELDYFGRILELRRIAYRDGKPGKAQWLARYRYQDDISQPTSIVRPSVVPGKQYRTQITFNDQGQPTRVLESGWSPAIDGAEAPTPIERSTTYIYASINGRSLLARIDGPTGSDITRLRYDSRGNYLAEIIRPGGTIIRISIRDDAGRPSAFTISDGAALLQTQLIHAPQGQLRHITQTGWLLKQASGQHEQVEEASKLTRRVDATHDGPGRPAAMHLSGFEQDLTDRQSAVPPQPAVATRQQPTTASEAAPTSGLQYRTGTPGSVAERAVQAIVSQAPGAAGSEHMLARRWPDDFGRLVAVQYPSQGLTRATYVGASDRIASLVDATGVRTQLHYDEEGRIDLLSRVTGNAQPAERIEFRYAGSRLIERIRHANAGQPASRMAYGYDAFGRIVEEQQRQGQLTYTVHHAYDDAGRRIRTWLSQQHGGGAALHLPGVHLRYHAEATLGDRVAAIDAGDSWFGKRTILSQLQWLAPPSVPHANAEAPWIAIAWHYGNGLHAKAEYAATQGPGVAYRLRTYHDGVHPYAIDSDRDGHVNAAVQGAVALNVTERGGTMLPQAGVSRSGNNANPMISSHGGAPPNGFGNGGEDDVPRDATGRRLTHQLGQERLNLVWNSAGQLTQVTLHGKTIATYHYDAQGRRVAKIIDGKPDATRHFIYSGNQLVAEANGRGDITRQFIHVGHRPVAWIEPAHGMLQRLRQTLLGPKIVFLHTDHRGAVTAATDRKQAILWRATPDTGGRVQEDISAHYSIEQPWRLAGQYADAETGLHYNLARYYDPHSRAFLSPDPAGLDAGSLDLYAYADGDHLNFFDPDGWAKIIYYAITAGADGKTALGMNQGFTKARWAFAITDIEGGAMRNVLYDPNGGFVKSRLNDEGRKGDAFAWNHNGEDDVRDPAQMMQQYYGDNLISISQFVIDHFDDGQARGVLRKLGYVHPDGSSNCKEGLLPEILFAPEDAPIDVTKAYANGANKQRLLVCGTGASDNLELRRIAKFEAAAEINETAKINRDCLKDACPGIGYYCSETLCFAPRDQLRYGSPLTKEPVYTPSYGRSQFTGTTFVEQLLTSRFTSEEQLKLGLTPTVQHALKIALAHGQATSRAYSFLAPALSYAEANEAWERLTVTQRDEFTNSTGLGEREYIDMKRMKTQPPRNSKGIDLSADAREAFATTAIMRSHQAGAYLKVLFSNFELFTIVSHSLMRQNLHAVQAAYPNAAENEIAARVARAHNGGSWKRPLSTLTSLDPNNYVKRFLGNPGYIDEGDWYSLRCVNKLFNQRGATPNKQESSIGGLEMTPLTLPSER